MAEKSKWGGGKKNERYLEKKMKKTMKKNIEKRLKQRIKILKELKKH